MKLKSTIITLISIVIVAVSGIMVYIYWPAITGTVNNNKYLTPEQGQAMYNKGYADGNKSEEEQLSQIDYYKNLADEYYIQFGIYNNEISRLNNTVASSNQTIQDLTVQKNNLQQQVVNLQNVKIQNENALQELNSQIVLLQAQANQVPELNIQIANLQALATQLQTTNQINSDTITSLNAQIVSLNNQIRDISATSQNASAQITALTNRCNELQASINYYESFISTQEDSNKAVATYEVDGAVWKIEIVNKGEITLPQFTNTNTVIFNGWMVSGNDTLLGNTYTINANTKFVASVIHKYAVQFMVDDVVYDGQYVVENECAIVPITPVKSGYDFLGWSLNGVDIVNDINTINVTENVIYHAVFVKVHVVTFMNGDQIVATQNVRNGEYANANNVTVETDGTFIGWQMNDSLVEIDNYQILADTIFVAQINFDNWSVVSVSGLNSKCELRRAFVWSYRGKYYYSCCNSSSLSSYNYQYVWNSDLNKWESMSWNGFQPRDGYGVLVIGDICYYYFSNGNRPEWYQLDIETYTWNKIEKTKDEIWLFDGGGYLNNRLLWSDGFDYYVSGTTDTSGGYGHWKYNFSTYKFEPMVWNGLQKFSGKDVFYDGNNYYCLVNQKLYVLNVSTHTWVLDDMTVEDGGNVYSGSGVWTDGINYYYSNGSAGQYKWNGATHTWETVIWHGVSVSILTPINYMTFLDGHVYLYDSYETKLLYELVRIPL